MYTAQIKNKTVLANGQVELDVEFTNGTDTFIEKVTPQDAFGLEHWRTARLRSLNSVEALKDIDPAAEQPVSIPEDPTPTAAELADQAWLKKYRKWVDVKTNLIDTGVITGNETFAVNLLQEVKDGLTPARFNLI